MIPAVWNCQAAIAVPGSVSFIITYTFTYNILDVNHQLFFRVIKLKLPLSTSSLLLVIVAYLLPTHIASAPAFNAFISW